MKPIKEYIQSKSFSWSATTIRSESARLYSMEAAISTGCPRKLYDSLVAAGYKPYTIKTMMTRASEYVLFATNGSNNSYKHFIKEHANLFKNSYIKEDLGELTWNQAKDLIVSSNFREPVKQLALFLLHTGLRAAEGLGYDGSGWVIGKGARKRRVFNAEGFSGRFGNVTYIELYNALKSVGLKPHTLRKLAATKLVEAGLKEADLMKVFGWTNIQTASLYLQPKNDDILAATLKAALT